MEIKTKHGKFEVNPITFNQFCELEGALADCMPPSSKDNPDAKMTTRSLFKFYGIVAEMAFDDPKKELKKHAMDEKYNILAKISEEYMGVGKDPLEKSGG